MAATPNPPRVFVDADVLIAGSASRTGAAHIVLQLGELGLIDLVSSAQARREAERNLAAKLPAALPAFRLIADACCRWVDDPAPADVKAAAGEAHVKDLPILLAAVAARCETLVTFNITDFHPTRLIIAIRRPGDFISDVRTRLGTPP